MKVWAEIRLKMSINLFDGKPSWIVSMISMTHMKNVDGLVLSSVDNCVILPYSS